MCSLSPVWLVSLKEEKKRHRVRQRHPKGDRDVVWHQWCVHRPRNALDCQQSREAKRKAWHRFSLEPPERTWPWILVSDLQPLELWGNKFILSSLIIVTCYSSTGKWLQLVRGAVKRPAWLKSKGCDIRELTKGKSCEFGDFDSKWEGEPWEDFAPRSAIVWHKIWFWVSLFLSQVAQTVACS